MSAAPEVVEGEVGHELELAAPVPANLFRSDEPSEIIERATRTANALSEVIKSKNLTSNISGREHVQVEGWTLLGTMLGVFPVCVWSREIENGWEARVEARTMSGAVVGAAEAHCLNTERNWTKNDSYALRSMAQTRATSKALRQPLGFVMTLAGFQATPAEEMPSESVTEAPRSEPAAKRLLEPGQVQRINELLESLEKALPSTLREEDWVTTASTWMKEQFDVEGSKDLNVAQGHQLIEELEAWLLAESAKV